MKNIFIIIICFVVITAATITFAQAKEEIKYTLLYQGFITCVEINPLPPNEKTLIFTDEESWRKFSSKYFYGLNSSITFSKPENSYFIDFNKKAIIFISFADLKEAYNISYNISTVFKKDNKIQIDYKSDHSLLILNKHKIKHPFIFILKIDSKYISDNLTNIYKEEE